MNNQEAILHQSIAVRWHNTYRNEPLVYQRLICQWNNAANKQYGNKMRSMGVKPGIADWQYLIKGGCIWIELKIETGTQSHDQLKFETLCKHLNHEYVIIRNEIDFFELINRYI